MKRIITLGLAAGIFMGLSANKAEAVEIDVMGRLVMTGSYSNDLGLTDGEMNTVSQSLFSAGDPNDAFKINQRIEVAVFINNSENLRAHLRFRAPSSDAWGSDAFAAGGGTASVTLLQAYVDWFIPNTEIKMRMGLQPLTLPTTMGSPVFDDVMAGVSVTAPINKYITLTAHAMRALDYSEVNAGGGNFISEGVTSESLDVFALTAPMQFNGFAIQPWATVAVAGEGFEFGVSRVPGTNRYAVTGSNRYYVGSFNWWAGFKSELTLFDPFKATLGFAYGEAENIGGKTSLESNGYVVDTKLEYNTQYGTPALVAWYASGDDGDNLHRMPQIGPSWASVTSAFFDQSQHSIAPATGVLGPQGTWAVGLAYTGFEAMKDLKLGGHIMYIRGTNDFDVAQNANFDASYLSTNDSIVELAAFATYDIYKNLQAAFEVNYLINDADSNYGNDENGMRMLLGFRYSF